jgi:hypothetical protein
MPRRDVMYAPHNAFCTTTVSYSSRTPVLMKNMRGGMGICIVSGIFVNAVICKLVEIEKWSRGGLSRLPPRISRLIERAGVRPQSLPGLIRKLDGVRRRRRMSALHGEEARLRTRWCQERLRSEADWRGLWPRGLVEVGSSR